MRDSPAEILRRARIARGFATAADAARAFGWHAATYTHHENGTRGIRPDAAQRYAAAFGISSSSLLGLTASRSQPVDEVPVMGRAEVGTWRDSRLDVARGKSAQFVPTVNVAGRVMRFAIEIADDSVSAVLPKGDFAICVPLDIERPALKLNWLVLVERERDGLVERSIRRVAAIDGDKIVLTSHSRQPGRRDTVHIPPSNAGETVLITGRVIGRYGTLENTPD